MTKFAETKRISFRFLNSIMNSPAFKNDRREINAMANAIADRINGGESRADLAQQCESCAEGITRMISVINTKRREIGTSSELLDLACDLVTNIWEALVSNGYKSFELYSEASKQYKNNRDFCAFSVATYSKSALTGLFPISTSEEERLESVSKRSIYSDNFFKTLNRYIRENYELRAISSLSEIARPCNGDVLTDVYTKLTRSECPFDRFDCKTLTKEALILCLTTPYSVSTFSQLAYNNELEGECCEFDAPDTHDLEAEFIFTHRVYEFLEKCRAEHSANIISDSDYHKVMCYTVYQILNGQSERNLNNLYRVGWTGHPYLKDQIDCLLSNYIDKEKLTLKDVFDYFSIDGKGYSASLNKVK